MTRGPLGSALVVALAAILVLAPGVEAAGVGGATWSPRDVGATVALSGFRRTRDSLYVFLTLTWDRAGVRSLRSYAEQEGLRYTQEINDISGRLSATGHWVSDLPDASFDRDDDDGDGRWEEAEVTTDAIPEPGRAYYVGIQFTRWHRDCEDPSCRWRWDHRGGRMVLLAQLSSYFLGEWQAIRWTAPFDSLPYPHRARPPRNAA